MHYYKIREKERTVVRDKNMTEEISHAALIKVFNIRIKFQIEQSK